MCPGSFTILVTPFLTTYLWTASSLTRRERKAIVRECRRQKEDVSESKTEGGGEGKRISTHTLILHTHKRITNTDLKHTHTHKVITS